jgi:hypothetical protein
VGLSTSIWNQIKTELIDIKKVYGGVNNKILPQFK